MGNAHVIMNLKTGIAHVQTIDIMMNVIVGCMLGIIDSVCVFFG